MSDRSGSKNTVFVQATLDESLRTIRARLLELDDPGGAYILIPLAPGQFAVISGYSLRKLVNDLERELAAGPKILEVTLGQIQQHYKAKSPGWDILPPQPGVERSDASDRQMREEARKFQNLLLLLESGQPSGVFDNTSPGIFVSGYDLLAKSLSQQELKRVTWIPAEANNTVAYVLGKLVEIPDRAKWDKVYVIVKTGTQEFGVLSAQNLRRTVEADGVDALDRALISFPLQSATVVDYDLTSSSEVRQMARQHPYIVVTCEGEPCGLIVREVTYRSFETMPKGFAQPDTSRIWGLSPADIQRARQQVDLKQPREVLPRFDKDGKPYPKDRALVYGHTYHFKLSIGSYDQAKSELPAEARETVPSIPADDQEGSNLYVSLFSDDFEFEQHTQELRLPTSGDSPEIVFKVTPTRRTLGPRDRAVLTVCIYYRCNVVQVLEMSTDVAPPSAEGLEIGGREWALKAARSKDFLAVQALDARELSLVITKERGDRYLFTFGVDPDEVDATKWEKIRLGCRINLTRDDLTHLITKARRQLYNAVQAYNLLRDPTTGAYDKAIRALAQVGRQLYLRLFGDGDGQVLKRWMKENLSTGSTIQIVNRAGDFVFPWSLIYEASPWDEEQEIDVEKFWGWRYKLAISTDALTSTYGDVGELIEAPEGLEMMVGLYARLKGAREQHKYFSGLRGQPEAQVAPLIVDRSSKALEALKRGQQHLIYFFCHGYTEKLAADIQLDLGADLLRQLTEQKAEQLDKKDEVVLEQLAELFDVSDSWLRLTRGKIPLTMLQEEMGETRLARGPLVFLNMCQSAQVLPSLSGGLIPFFIARGARAVIGTECSMNMVFGDQFAREFLDRFLQGIPAAEVLWRLRQETLNKGDPLALAYTLFGDASLRLQKPALQAKAKTTG